MRTDRILQLMNARRREMLEALEALVKCESPSSDKAAVDRCLDRIARRAEALGACIRRHRVAEFGDHLQADFQFPAAGRRAGRLLVLGHADTVWNLGTLNRMPFRVKRGRVYGPGVFDMKSGIVSALFAIQALRDLHVPLRKQITLLAVSDEEVGSASSRPITERLARGCDAVLVPEPPAGPQGALKTARKGVGDYRLEVHGRAAHAGIDFAGGASATAELARQLVRIARFTRLSRGITVNIGVIGGGTRANVVAEQAWADVDVRIARLADSAYIQKQFATLRPFDTRTRLEITGGLNRPPMERTAAIGGLFQRARQLAQPLGLDLRESMSGGGSDGNFTAALGIPTLDGLGVTGEGAHATNENIVLAEFPKRAALLAHLLAAL
jgi:glutamate carboxypeptidase